MTGRSNFKNVKFDPMTQDELMEVIAYDPKTGVFTWTDSPLNRGRSVGVAGHVMRNRYVLRVMGRTRTANRLAVLYMTGAWPTNLVAYKDGDAFNNAWDNLVVRYSLEGEGSQQSPDPEVTRTKGNRWKAEAYHGGLCVFFGIFKKMDDAILVKNTTMAKYFAEDDDIDWESDNDYDS